MQDKAENATRTRHENHGGDGYERVAWATTWLWPAVAIGTPAALGPVAHQVRSHLLNRRPPKKARSADRSP
jgi:hypothetical protein